MKSLIVAGILSVAVILAAPSRAVAGAAGGPAGIRPRLVVRLYDAAGLDAATQRAAVQVAQASLESVTGGITWRECRAGGPAGDGTSPDAARDACARPLGPNEMVVRFVRVPLADRYRGTLRLGDSFVDGTVRTGALATVYVTRVAWLANEASSDMRALLGRTMAHEIGHLLLGSNHHGRRGLMRARWSREELQRNRAEDWRFSDDDRRGIEEASLVRAGASPDGPATVAQRFSAARSDPAGTGIP